MRVLNRDGEMVGALEANLPDGVKLIYSDGLISAVSDSDTSFRCIDNKWVSFSVTAVGAGITALNC